MEMSVSRKLILLKIELSKPLFGKLFFFFQSDIILGRLIAEFFSLWNNLLEG